MTEEVVVFEAVEEVEVVAGEVEETEAGGLLAVEPVVMRFV